MVGHLYNCLLITDIVSQLATIKLESQSVNHLTSSHATIIMPKLLVDGMPNLVRIRSRSSWKSELYQQRGNMKGQAKSDRYCV